MLVIHIVPTGTGGGFEWEGKGDMVWNIFETMMVSQVTIWRT